MDKIKFIKSVFDNSISNVDTIQDNLSRRESWFLHNYISKSNFLKSISNDSDLIDEMYSVAQKINSFIS